MYINTFSSMKYSNAHRNILIILTVYRCVINIDYIDWHEVIQYQSLYISGAMFDTIQQHWNKDMGKYAPNEHWLVIQQF